MFFKSRQSIKDRLIKEFGKEAEGDTTSVAHRIALFGYIVTQLSAIIPKEFTYASGWNKKNEVCYFHVINETGEVVNEKIWSLVSKVDFEKTIDEFWEIYEKNVDKLEVNNVEIDTTKEEKVIWLDPNLIDPSPYQKRTHFSGIEELAESIRRSGQDDPIKVYKNKDNDRYTLIDGERRLRACQQIDIKIKAIVSDERYSFSRGIKANFYRDGLSYKETAFAMRDVVLHIKKYNQYDIYNNIVPEETRQKWEKSGQLTTWKPLCNEIHEVLESEFRVKKQQQYNLLNSLDLPEEVQEVMDNSKIQFQKNTAVLIMDELSDKMPIQVLRAFKNAQKAKQQIEKAVKKAKDAKDDNAKFLTAFTWIERIMKLIKRILANVDMSKVDEETERSVANRLKTFFEFINKIGD